MSLKDLLIRHEGLRLKPYKDSVGKLTIGVGRNLDDVGITKDEAIHLLFNDVVRCEQELRSHFNWFDSLDEVRKDVVVSMVFNLGIVRFLGFKKTIQAIALKDYDKASTEMLDSLWSKQVGSRAYELSEMMRLGKYLENREGIA